MKSEEFKLPEGWKWVKLGEIFDIYAGGDISKLNFSPVKTKKFKYPIFSNSLENKGLYGYADTWQYPENSVTITGRGTLGYAVPRFEKFNAIIRLLVLIPKIEVDITFIAEYINAKVNFSIENTGVAQLTVPKISEYLIPLPPLPEQRKIAEILETVDNAIEKTEKIIEKYKRIKQGLMQELLTKGIDENWQIRSEKTHKFKDSPLGRIPEEWEMVRLGDIANQIIDGTHHTPRYVEDGIPFLRVTDIQENSINLESVKKITPQEHKILSKRCKPEKGDILYSKNGTIGTSKVVDWDWEFSIFVSLCLIKPKHNVIYNKYLKYFLDSEIVKKQIFIRSKQLSVTNLHLEEIKEFLVLHPPLPEQQRIAEVLSQIDEVIEKEENYKKKLESLKRGLMEDLLTGKVRVNKLL